MKIYKSEANPSCINGDQIFLKKLPIFKVLIFLLPIIMGVGLFSNVNAQVAELYSSGSTTICAGESTTIAVSISASVGPYTVVYNDGTSDHTVSNYSSDEISDDDITISPTTTTTYSLVSVEDTYGTNLLPISSNTVTITVNPVPTNINPPDTKWICSDSGRVDHADGDGD